MAEVGVSMDVSILLWLFDPSCAVEHSCGAHPHIRPTRVPRFVYAPLHGHDMNFLEDAFLDTLNPKKAFMARVCAERCHGITTND